MSKDVLPMIASWCLTNVTLHMHIIISRLILINLRLIGSITWLSPLYSVVLNTKFVDRDNIVNECIYAYFIDLAESDYLFRNYFKCSWNVL